MDTSVERLVALRESGMTWAEVGATVGLKPDAVRKRVRRAGVAPNVERPTSAVEQVTIDQTAEGVTVNSRASRRIRTVDDLIEQGYIDTARYEITRAVVNTWETAAVVDDELTTETLHQVKVWLDPLRALIDSEAVIADMVADMQQHAPTYELPTGASASGAHLFEPCIADHHIGMLAWGEETGEDYDSAIAQELALQALGTVTERASAYDIGRVLLPLGNDFLHTDRTLDGKGGTTARGTVQDVDTRWQRSFRNARHVAVAMIDALREVAPVEVVVVPGNHDTERMFYIGHALEAWYRNDQHVVIRNTPRPRKYVHFGLNLLGFTHGHLEKWADLPMLMATEAPEAWAATKGGWREWHTAHFHAKRNRRLVLTEVVDDQGVMVRTLPSLAAADSYHVGKGYMHQRAAEAFVWHESEGLVAKVAAPLSALEK